ncbi:hypothetical protein [Vibrio parahaemolyticus]|uniref:hypothetical protein n=1 Tax=Vibrio parahaemolyticus TaxID=670 RepID=UPI0011247C49|nr:hypothetical protein [Vibrio parahaemolyticus]TOM96830.1 hypothetical protein CGH65_20760 [Vibrio parahaemolyticus]
MNTLKQYTLFVNGKLCKHKNNKNEWMSAYGIDDIHLINNNTKNKDSLVFVSEKEQKLMKSLSNAGYSRKNDKNRYDSIRRRLSNFYKQTFTTKDDWKHIVDTSGGVLKIWLANIEYNRHDKRVSGDVALFRESKTELKVELIKYQTSIIERYGKKDGRYHDFSKDNDYKSFTHHLEMERQELRTNTYVKKLRDNATLKENTEHNNEIANAHNNLVDAVEKQKQMIEELQRELALLKMKAA